MSFSGCVFVHIAFQYYLPSFFNVKVKVKLRRGRGDQETQKIKLTLKQRVKKNYCNNLLSVWIA